MMEYKPRFDEISEEEATIEISNQVFKSLKFRSREEAFAFVDKYCPNLWTKLKRKTEAGWIVAGSIIPREQKIMHKGRISGEDYNNLI